MGQHLLLFTFLEFMEMNHLQLHVMLVMKQIVMAIMLITEHIGIIMWVLAMEILLEQVIL